MAEQVVSALELKAIPGLPGSEQPATLAALVPTHKFQRRQRPSRESNATSVPRAFADLALRLHFQEVADHLVTAFGQYGLGMKLHALNR